MADCWLFHRLLEPKSDFLDNLSVLAFPPPSPEQERIADEKATTLCQSRGESQTKRALADAGNSTRTPADVCSAWHVRVDCRCHGGYGWNETSGCRNMMASGHERDNALIYYYAGMSILIIACMAIFIRTGLVGGK